MKKFVALFLVFSLLALSGNLYAKKKGAELAVEETDGQQVRGELIAVKQNSLLLLDSEAADVSIDVSKIKNITIVKKSKVFLGAGLGLLIGAVAGAVIGKSIEEGHDIPVVGPTAGAGIIGGVAAGVIGGLIGASAGKDNTIQIEGKSDSEIKEILESLRKKSRVSDYQ